MILANDNFSFADYYHPCLIRTSTEMTGAWPWVYQESRLILPIQWCLYIIGRVTCNPYNGCLSQFAAHIDSAPSMSELTFIRVASENAAYTRDRPSPVPEARLISSAPP